MLGTGAILPHVLGTGAILPHVLGTGAILPHVLGTGAILPHVLGTGAILPHVLGTGAILPHVLGTGAILPHLRPELAAEMLPADRHYVTSPSSLAHIDPIWFSRFLCPGGGFLIQILRPGFYQFSFFMPRLFPILLFPAPLTSR